MNAKGREARDARCERCELSVCFSASSCGIGGGCGIGCDGGARSDASCTPASICKRPPLLDIQQLLHSAYERVMIHPQVIVVTTGGGAGRLSTRFDLICFLALSLITHHQHPIAHLRYRTFVTSCIAASSQHDGASYSTGRSTCVSS